MLLLRINWLPKNLDVTALKGLQSGLALLWSLQKKTCMQFWIGINGKMLHKAFETVLWVNTCLIKAKGDPKMISVLNVFFGQTVYNMNGV